MIQGGIIMRTQVFANEYWMLSELLLNVGYDKQQLAQYLNTTPGKINEVLRLSIAPSQEDQAFTASLERLYLARQDAL